MLLTSAITLGATLPSAPESVIKVEPMLHRADWAFASTHGGLLTKAFLETLSNNFDWSTSHPVLIDSRVHMLMPGFYPAITGWHGDDVPRTRSDGQPDYENRAYDAKHVMAIWGDCSRTEFALGAADFTIPPLGSKVYKEMSPMVERLCVEGKLGRWQVPERTMVYFDWASWHRAMETTHRGFRFFIRATRDSGLAARNEIRMNANVYLKDLDESW